jgi:hypothetical protein
MVQKECVNMKFLANVIVVAIGNNDLKYGPITQHFQTVAKTGVHVKVREMMVVIQEYS